MAKAKARAHPGVLDRWNDADMKHAKERWGAVWRDPKYRSAKEAFAALPKQVQDDLGTIRTAYRVFDRRKPDDPCAGGRGHKKPVKHKRKR